MSSNTAAVELLTPRDVLATIASYKPEWSNVPKGKVWGAISQIVGLAPSTVEKVFGGSSTRRLPNRAAAKLEEHFAAESWFAHIQWAALYRNPEGRKPFGQTDPFIEKQG